MQSIVRDLSATVRGLRRSPWFSLIAIGALSVGLGANILLFSVLNAVRRPESPGQVAMTCRATGENT